ncbi:MAG: UTP--glucose-1-phosphate uridylyltransferase [Planctomycetia bacterium]|nr:UTP--glucose-1-phosphate uridylyltransferase [Planctomycetia bacterium]
MTIDLAIVPVAGHGTRLLPATKTQPKEMLPVGKKPVVQYVVEELAQSGVRRVLFVTGRGKASIENHFDVDAELTSYLRETGREEQLAELSFERLDVSFGYTRQRRQLGLGHAVLCAQTLARHEPFVVALGDSIIGLNAKSQIVRRMIETFEKQRADAVICFEEVAQSDVVHYGIAQPKSSSRGAPKEADVFELAGIVEKPRPDESPSNLAVAARYVFQPSIFDHLRAVGPGKGGEIQLTDAVARLIEQGGKVLGLRLAPDEKRYDIGNFESYFRAFVEFTLADGDFGPALRAHLQKLLAEAP